MRSTDQHTGEHRPATRPRLFRHDDIIAGDLFSGFGGLTRGMEAAGVTTIMAANHNRYKVEVHEANHPDAEHFVADLVDPDRGDYYSPAELPAVDWLAAGVSCISHSGANAKKAYAQGRSLFEFDDPDWEARVTKSERDRAISVCVLQYASIHRPRVILLECTTELTSWGPAIPGTNIGDGSTYRWWLAEMLKLGYRKRTLYLNSMFFGVPQSRDRLYLVFTNLALPAPNLDHRPTAWCHRCDTMIEARWTWRTRIPRTGRVRYGHQYDYRCPSCRHEVVPPHTPAIEALDLTNLGTRIGDRDKPLAATSMARVQRCIDKFRQFPAVLMPAKALPRGVDRHPWQPLATQTSQQETALVSTGALAVVAGNTHERPGSQCRSRGFDEPLWTQHATNAVGVVTPPVAAVVPYRAGNQPTLLDVPLPTQGGHEALALVTTAIYPNRTNGTARSVDQPMQTLVASSGSGGLGLVSAGVLPYRQHTVPTHHSEPMPTLVAGHLPALVTATTPVTTNADGDLGAVPRPPRPVSEPSTSVPAEQLLVAGFYKQNGGPADTAPHPLSDPLGTLTARDTTGVTIADWHQLLDGLEPDDCYFRMLTAPEVGRGCGFGADFKVWGSTRDQVDGYGNAVSPPVGTWLSLRIKDIL